MTKLTPISFLLILTITLFLAAGDAEAKKDKDKDKDQDNKVTVCHDGDELSVSESALDAHLDHGDTEGKCEDDDEEDTDKDKDKDKDDEAEGAGNQPVPDMGVAPTRRHPNQPKRGTYKPRVN